MMRDQKNYCHAGGKVAERSEALLLREKTNENQKVPSFVGIIVLLVRQSLKMMQLNKV